MLTWKVPSGAACQDLRGVFGTGHMNRPVTNYLIHLQSVFIFRYIGARGECQVHPCFSCERHVTPIIEIRSMQICNFFHLNDIAFQHWYSKDMHLHNILVLVLYILLLDWSTGLVVVGPMVKLFKFDSCCDCCRAANAIFCSMVGRWGRECGWVTSGTCRDGLWSMRIADDSEIDGRRRRWVLVIGEEGANWLLLLLLLLLSNSTSISEEFKGVCVPASTNFPVLCVRTKLT